jgi:hypothetical protein
VPSRSRFGVAADAVGRWTDLHPVILFAVLTAWYIALVWNLALKPLWYDELFTFYIAQQPTVARMLEAIRSIDFNPPLNYFLTRWSIHFFGASPWATRLPAIVGFWAGSLAVFELLRRQASALIGLIGVILLWCTPFFVYAAQARPYGLLLASTALLIAAWDATAAGHRKLGLPLVGLTAILLLLSHVFGTLSLGAVCLGETVRTYRQRKADWPMIGALLLPLVATVAYVPMLHTFRESVFPPEAMVTWGKLYYLYFAIFRWMWRPLLALVLIAFVYRNNDRGDSEGIGAHTRHRGTGLILALLFLIPVALAGLFMRSHGAFYDRYAMVAVLPIVLITPILLRRLTSGSTSASFAGCIAIAFLLLLSTALRTPVVRAASALFPERTAVKVSGLVITSPHGPFRPWWKPLPVPANLLEERARAPLLTSLVDFHPQLPLVAASELTFTEMGSREPTALTSRLCYVYDREAELQLSHRTIAQGVLDVQQFFPKRGCVISYNTFVAQHREFLVIGTYEHPGDWLLRKIAMNGASLEIVARYEGYAATDIYLVEFPDFPTH